MSGDTYATTPGVPKRLLDAFGPLGADPACGKQNPASCDLPETIHRIVFPFRCLLGWALMVRLYLRED